ncbi:hypothetical protein LNV08_11685 [Paucibacter sp. TC2R-5]|uniref:hypothetical protein n=1 Tax=Paucibacter sp. TC2R-5 TaxID=2893555 RepID=UPI0021E3DA92|nr:hypothetical protein [Paucibacter sp. TC2R-5]MCV2359630.1 hypothetical protein [Paucibacter sp. TC2R-5]
MSYTLTVAPVIELPIKFSTSDSDQNQIGKKTEFFFHLRAKRMDQAALRAAMNDTDLPTKDLLQQQIVGWRGQRLVQNGSGEMAEFTAEAFDCMLSLVGIEQLILNAYLRAVVQADSLAEKAKN